MTHKILTPFDCYNTDQIGKTVTVKGQIKEIQTPIISTKNAIFECRSCMRLHEVPQNIHKKTYKPAVCQECGGRSFRLLLDESEYKFLYYFTLHDPMMDVELKTVIADSNIFRMKRLRESDEIEIRGELIVQNEEGLELLLVRDNDPSNQLSLPEPKKTESPEENEITRNSPEYINWRKEILKNNTHCVRCNSPNNLHIHHIYGYKEYPSLRIDPNNGVVLCKDCHTDYHSEYGYKENVNPCTLFNFLGIASDKRLCPPWFNPKKEIKHKKSKKRQIVSIAKKTNDKGAQKSWFISYLGYNHQNKEEMWELDTLLYELIYEKKIEQDKYNYSRYRVVNG